MIMARIVDRFRTFDPLGFAGVAMLGRIIRKRSR
jgi:hypothetical protein